MEYLIKKGDTLSGIAKKHGTTVKGLLDMNPQIKDPDKIYAGRKLNLPESEKMDNLGGGKKCEGLGCLSGMSPFNMHPANMMMKGLLGFNNTHLPPPMNAMTSMMGRMMPTVTGPGADGPIEPVAGLEQLIPFIGKTAPVANTAIQGTMRNPMAALFQPRGIQYAVGDYRNPYLEYASQGLVNATKR